jgi:uncharacterized membrane protein
MLMGTVVLWLAVQLNLEFPAGAMAWVELVLRWLHFVAGITWIGLLYFFNLVNVPLLKALDAPTKGKVVPQLMPRALWWFRWGAVVTVLAGLLYFLIYLMRDARNAGNPGLLGKWFGLWLVIWVLVWGALYLLVRPAPANGALFGVIGAAIVAAGTWALLAVMAHPEISNKSLAIGAGGGMGMVMLLNVWGVIWRIQKRLIAWTQANAEQGTPMPAEATKLARIAFLTSRFNAWLSIPMLFFMASASHFPFLSGK